MGLFRLILALSVVIIHAYPIFGQQFLASNVAVDSFFIISGFYMAFILHEKYVGKNGSYKLFLTNRLLRIFPLYWVIIILLFSLSLIEFFASPGSDNALRIMMRVASESPVPWFTGLMMILRNTTLILTTDYFQTNFHTPGYLLLLPAWTLQMELLFYLLAPFVTRLKLPYILVLSGLFGWLTFVNPFPSLNYNPTVATIFISKFVFFLLGILSYYLFRRMRHATFTKQYSSKIVFSFFVITAIFGVISTDVTVLKQDDTTFFIYFLLVMLAIPFLFFSSRKNKVDARLADLSYPVYLSHIVIFKILTHSPVNHLNHSFITLLTLTATIGFSWILVRLVEKPIDTIRKNMLE